MRLNAQLSISNKKRHPYGQADEPPAKDHPECQERSQTVNEKQNWAELNGAKTSGIVTGEAPVSYWPIFFFLSPITVPEIFPAQFHLFFQSGES